MLEVALDRLLGMVARMEGMPVRHVRVVRSLLVCSGLMVLRRFLMMLRRVLVVFSRLPMMFSRLFRHGILRLRVNDDRATCCSNAPGFYAVSTVTAP
jgi:hypothetical protein